MLPSPLSRRSWSKLFDKECPTISSFVFAGRWALGASGRLGGLESGSFVVAQGLSIDSRKQGLRRADKDVGRTLGRRDLGRTQRMSDEFV